MKYFLFCVFGVAFSITISAQEFDGYALYNAEGNFTYLIDKNGDIAHRWSGSPPNSYASLLTEEGNLMRTAVYSANRLSGAAVAGVVQLIDKDSEVIWEFVYSDENHVSHHDITLMPNGGVLLIAWERKTSAELVAIGYTGNKVKWPTHFVEVQPDGNGGGKIVWEWHLFDHLIQDVDPNRPNYGNVSENPQLIDVNVATGSGEFVDGDWFHVNGVDYNEDLDLITFSSRYLSEIFVIDHSTTTAEAASHSGGNSGMGGDLLYRWGKPANYKTVGFRNISGPVHDARFIPNDGRFRGGWIQFFNNDGPGNLGSTVDAINPPWNGKTFDRVPGEAYLPKESDFRLVCREQARGQSASAAMRNGNTFVNLSRGYMYEVDKNRNLVWQFSEGPLKAFRYTCDHPGIQLLLGSSACESPVELVDTLVEKKLILMPNPSAGIFQITGLSGENDLEEIIVTDAVGKEFYRTSKVVNSINLTGHSPGIYFVKFCFKNKKTQVKVVSVNR